MTDNLPDIKQFSVELDKHYFVRKSPGVERKEALVSREMLEGLKRIEAKLDKIMQSMKEPI